MNRVAHFILFALAACFLSLFGAIFFGVNTRLYYTDVCAVSVCRQLIMFASFTHFDWCAVSNKHTLSG